MRVEGTITLTDGSASSFSVDTEYGWQQWGAGTERLGQTVGILDAIESALASYIEDEGGSDEA
jgi:hypothetical protein